jgi:hypothetical protein
MKTTASYIECKKQAQDARSEARERAGGWTYPRLLRVSESPLVDPGGVRTKAGQAARRFLITARPGECAAAFHL